MCVDRCCTQKILVQMCRYASSFGMKNGYFAVLKHIFQNLIRTEKTSLECPYFLRKTEHFISFCIMTI